MKRLKLVEKKTIWLCKSYWDIKYGTIRYINSTSKDRVAIDFSRKNRRLILQKQEKAGDLKKFRNMEKTGVFCRG